MAVSACHGLHPSPDFPQGDPAGPGCYTTLLRSWFESTFPGVGSTKKERVETDG
jgi:hypothetical protein